MTVIELPPIRKGEERAFCECKVCGAAYFYDYVPYSLSVPLTVLPCHHVDGIRPIEMAVALQKMAQQNGLPKPESGAA